MLSSSEIYSDEDLREPLAFETEIEATAWTERSKNGFDCCAFPKVESPAIEFNWFPLVPLRKLSDCRGPRFPGKRLSQFLPIGETDYAPRVDVEHQIRHTLLRGGDWLRVSDYLADDWDFEKLRIQAHENLLARNLQTFADQLVWLVLDFESAPWQKHSELPAVGVSTFWASWQLERHLIGFCRKVWSGEGVSSAHLEDARRFVRWTIADYVAYVQNLGLRPHTSESGGPTLKRRHGPLPDMKNHRKVQKLLASFGPNWRDQPENFAEIAEALDDAKIPIPPNWEKGQPKASDWLDGLTHKKENFIKALDYRLKMAARETVCTEDPE
jgi:hypothetical protein